MSTHPDAATAVGEVVGEILERIGEQPDVTIAFVSESHAKSVELIHAALRRLLGGSLVGCTSNSIVGGSIEVEDAAAISLWSAQLDDATPVRITGEVGERMGITPNVVDDISGREDMALLLLADPYSFGVDEALDQFAEDFPNLDVVGGMASPARGPGTTRLFCDDEIFENEAVGLLIGGGVLLPIVSQGCRPVGQPMIVTAADGNIMRELAGQSALKQLRTVFETLTEDEKVLVNQGLHLGRVVDESISRFDRGDFLIRGVLGMEEDSGSLIVGDIIEVGATVQFQIRDAESASEDLNLALWNAHDARGAVVFTCNGRGQHLFGEPGHDAGAINERLGISAVAGMFCAGEIGPVGTRSFVHGFTASIAFFADPPA